MPPFFGAFGNDYEPDVDDTYLTEDWVADMRAMQWKRTEWHSANMVVFFYPEDGVRACRALDPNEDQTGLEIAPDAWDHDHCDICGWKLLRSDDVAENTGYRNDTSWLCIKCHFALFGTHEDQVAPDQTKG